MFDDKILEIFLLKANLTRHSLEVLADMNNVIFNEEKENMILIIDKEQTKLSLLSAENYYIPQIKEWSIKLLVLINVQLEVKGRIKIHWKLSFFLYTKKPIINDQRKILNTRK